MKAIVIKDTKEIDYPFITITKGSIVDVIGSILENGAIPVRVQLGTEYEHNALVKAKDLEAIEEWNMKYILTCDIKDLKNFIPNNTNDYVYYVGLGKGKILTIDIKTKEIEFSSIELLQLIEGKYEVLK